jgi:Domain of unknown function (DUF4276)
MTAAFQQGLILVEGQTEETFGHRVLNPHLHVFGLHLEPKIVVTKRIRAGGHFKGGAVSYEQVRNDLVRLLHAPHVAVITTMFDLYALPTDFPGMATRPVGDFRARVAHLEDAWAGNINDRRFLPHIMLHEFETVLFSSPASLTVFDEKVRTEMTNAVVATGDPEAINEKRETSPSHRIAAWMPRYDKVRHGVIGASDITLPRIRTACTHFHAWLTSLEVMSRRRVRPPSHQ